MSIKKIWYVRRINPENGIITERHPCSPMLRNDALAICHEWSAYGWRVWADRNDTGERIFQSEAELIEHAKLSRQVILAYKGGDYQLRVILDDGTEQRIKIGLVGKLDNAFASARNKGYNPDGFISMPSMGRLVTCYQPK